MKGIQFLLVIVTLSLTVASHITTTDFIPSNNHKDIIQTPQNLSECVPFRKPIDCEEVRLNGNTANGVYTIWPKSRKLACKSVEVYCDMRVDGGGWTVLQRRGQYGNAVNYFNKTWEIYKHGFGQLDKEFWLGNEIIFALTNQGPYAVRFDMLHQGGTVRGYALYDQFWIEDEEQKYKLNIAGYSGDAGDVMFNHMKFSTLDNANQIGIKNCADTISGGWWFRDCYTSNLNGLNKLEGSNVNTILWREFSGFSLKFTEIKIRPRYFR